MAVKRYERNPLLAPADIPPLHHEGEIIGVFNAGVARWGEETILLLRVAERPHQHADSQVRTFVYDPDAKAWSVRSFSIDDPTCDFSDERLVVTHGVTYLTSLSYLRVARSHNGFDFTLDEGVLLSPNNAYEAFGLEDPRITFIDGTYFIHYVAVSPWGVCTVLARTSDFRTVERQGIIFGPENKDVAIFPERLNGKYYCLHRPTAPFAQHNEIWLAESPDLMCWGNHRHLLGLRDGAWDSHKIGAGAPPVRINEGWLEIYHGANDSNCYCLGALLLDAEEPQRILARSQDPILVPEMDYECQGFFGQVVFTCGLLHEEQLLKIYYGASDTSIAYVEIPIGDVLSSMEAI
ncbi:glycoside hydrolase family 130 protein [Planctomycetota bacterium]